MRKILIVILAITLNSFTLQAAELPCARKLLATGDRVQDTTQFTTYLESLIEKRIVSLNDLDPFLKELELGNITNPVPNTMANKLLVFWHREFQKLVDAHAIELEKIQSWSNETLLKVQKIQEEKEVANSETKDLPIYISYNDAHFYKFNHPTLGDVIKILKPKGRFGNPDDWEKNIWMLSPIMSKNNKNNKNKLLKTDQPAEACKKIGGLLPNRADYVQLMNYFHQKPSPSESKIQIVRLTKKGLAQFEDFQTQAQANMRLEYWTSDTFDQERNWFFNGKQGLVIQFRQIGYTGKPYHWPVICIAPLQGINEK